MAFSIKMAMHPCSTSSCHSRSSAMPHRCSLLHRREVLSTKTHHRSRTQVRAADGDPPESIKINGSLEGITAGAVLHQEKPASSSEEPSKGTAAGIPKLEKGQGTAIVTGAVSIIFGVLYLVLIQLLDTRGTQLEPPPPEAFGL